jgi:hypothetical protein
MSKKHQTITAPGISATTEPQEATETPVTGDTMSATAGFDAVRHVLSDKPLRRPNRTKPLDSVTKRKRRRK